MYHYTELVAARAKLAQFEARPGEEEPPELTRARAEAAAAAGGAGAVKETREWQSLNNGMDSGNGGGCGPGACAPSSCAGCGPTTEEAKKAGRAAEEEGGADDQENAEPTELNIEPLDIKFGSIVSIVKHASTEEALDELD